MNRKVLSWALYDWANSAYATTVMAGFFPVFFKEHWASDVSAADSTFRLGVANSIASIVVAALAPILGAIADRGGSKKRFLIFFAAMGVVMTGSLPLVAQGQWAVAALLYVVSMIGFAGGNVFYDALIVSVADDSKVDFVSALGFSAGYLGGGLLFTLNILMVSHPGWFGFENASAAVQASFVTVAVWWAVFSVPILLFVPEPRAEESRAGWGRAIREGFAQLHDTFRAVRRLRVTFLFLVAYWLYIDGVDTVMRMAVDYGLSIGFESNSLVTALLITQFVGFPAAIAFGKLGERVGAKTGILVGIAVYAGVTVWAFFMSRVAEFYALAVAIGLVQGGIQALSRSTFSRLIPAGKSAEFFGFYNMLGKFAAVLGPLLMAAVVAATGSTRASILSLILLFAAGASVLFKLDLKKGAEAARGDGDAL